MFELNGVPQSDLDRIVNGFKRQGFEVEVIDEGNGLFTVKARKPTAATPPANATAAPDPATTAGFAAELTAAADRMGVDRLALGSIAWIESRFKNVQNTSGSSARGPFQFMRKTWDGLVDQHGAAFGITKEMIDSPAAQCVMAAAKMRDEQKGLASVLGRQPDATELYLAHHFGLSAAKVLVKAGASKKIDEVLRDFYAGTSVGAGFVANILAQNPHLKDETGKVRTVAQVKKHFDGRLAEGRAKCEELFASIGASLTGTGSEGEPPWLTVARQEIGQLEIDGEGSNPRIEEYFSTTTLGEQTDDVPWCAAFVSFCLAQAGAKSLRSARAADWLGWGKKLAKPKAGCVVVLKPTSEGTSGHVGFYVGETEKNVNLLGGNQSDQVKITPFAKSLVQPNGYRWMDP